MLKLINLSTYEYDMERYDNDSQKINEFLDIHNIDGIELFGLDAYKEMLVPKHRIKGIHLRHYPMWLDFWKENYKEMYDDFKSVDDIIKFYGGSEKNVIIDAFRKEIKMAEELNAEYVVFHVSNVKLKHCYNYNFTYTDKDVLDASIELINEIFKDLNTNITILFENLWWPGLRMVDVELVRYFLENIQYENKGVMLDTGHLLNTNLDIENEEDGIDYLIETVNKLGNLKEYIKGIHLSKSLSSEYVKKQILKYRKKEVNFEDISEKVFFHIINIDQHKPFTNRKIKALIDMIDPKYLVYEFITISLDELSSFINIQDTTLELCNEVII